MVFYTQKKYIQKLSGCSPRNGLQHVYFPNGLTFEIKYALDPKTGYYPDNGLIVPGIYMIQNFSKDINSVYACCATCQQTYILSENMSFELPEVCAYEHEPQIIVWCDPDDNVTIPFCIYVNKEYLVSVGSTPIPISLRNYSYVPFNCTLTVVNDNTGVEVFIETLDGYKVHIDHAHCHYRKIFPLKDDGEPRFTKTIDLSFHKGLLEKTFQEKFGSQNSYQHFTIDSQQVNSTLTPSANQGRRRFYPNAPLRSWDVLAKNHTNFQQPKGLTADNYRVNTNVPSNGCACVNKNFHNPSVIIEIKSYQCSSEKQNDNKTLEKQGVDNARPETEDQQKETFKNQNDTEVQDSSKVAKFDENGIPDYLQQPLPIVPPTPCRSYFKALNADHLLEASKVSVQSHHPSPNVESIQSNLPESIEQLPPPMLSFQRLHKIASNKELSGILPSEVSEPSLNGIEPSLLKSPSMPFVKDTAHNSEADDEFDNEPSSSESDDEEEYFSCSESIDKPITSDADIEDLLANFQVLNINMDAVNHMTAVNDNDDPQVEDSAQVLSNFIF